VFPLPTDQPEERRGEPRRICHGHCLVRFDRAHLDGQPGSVGVQGYICDLSANGLSLLLRPAIPAGATVAIAPLGSSAKRLPLAHVVRCVPAGRRWRHGCSLDRRLSEEEMNAWLK
jgi:hypothetical protein